MSLNLLALGCAVNKKKKKPGRAPNPILAQENHNPARDPHSDHPDIAFLAIKQAHHVDSISQKGAGQEKTIADFSFNKRKQPKVI